MGGGGFKELLMVVWWRYKGLRERCIGGGWWKELMEDWGWWR